MRVDSTNPPPPSQDSKFRAEDAQTEKGTDTRSGRSVHPNSQKNIADALNKILSSQVKALQQPNSKKRSCTWNPCQVTGISSALERKTRGFTSLNHSNPRRLPPPPYPPSPVPIPAPEIPRAKTTKNNEPTITLDQKSTEFYTKQEVQGYLDIIGKTFDKLNLSQEKIIAYQNQLNNNNKFDFDAYKKIVKDINKNILKPAQKNKDFDDKFAQQFNSEPNLWQDFIYNIEQKDSVNEKKYVLDVNVKQHKNIDNSAFEEGFSGRSSLSKERNHVRNLRMISVQTKNQNSNVVTENSPSMKIIAHACVYDNQDALKELLKAAVLSQYNADDLKTKDSIDFFYANIQLTTTSILGDGDMALKQMKAFKKLGNPITLNFGDKAVKINFQEPLLFNFGCNLQHFNISSNTKKVDKQNDKSLKTLETLVNKFSDEDSKKTKIQNLWGQIKYIWDSKSYKTNDSEPYAIQVRLAALLNLLGYTTSVNCKSGKDRTGVFGDEFVAFSGEVLNSETIPTPYENDSRILDNLKTVAKAGIAQRCAKSCLGICGLKIVSKFLNFTFNSVHQRLGEDINGAYY